MGTPELMALAGLNFLSVLLAVEVLNARTRRRNERLAKAVVSQIEAQLETERAFTQIVRENFTDTEEQ
jgi:precorrin-2 methylase